MSKYEVKHYGTGGDDFGVYDINAPGNANLVYDEMSELEAATIAAILNDGIGPEWDSVTADYRWLMVQKVKEQTRRIDDLYRRLWG
jgi:hypothetical protein